MNITEADEQAIQDDPAEAAYWLFDKERQNKSYSERDNFKRVFRAVVARHAQYKNAAVGTSGWKAVKAWPFVESPNSFANRLRHALKTFGLLAAVRHVLIEDPPILRAEYALRAAAPENKP